MSMGKKRLYSDIIFTRIKKHFCPNCGEKLSLITCSKVINSKSEESKKLNFVLGDTFMVGDIKFIYDEFKCNKCNFQVSVKELKQIEKGDK